MKFKRHIAVILLGFWLIQSMVTYGDIKSQHEFVENDSELNGEELSLVASKITSTSGAATEISAGELTSNKLIETNFKSNGSGLSVDDPYKVTFFEGERINFQNEYTYPWGNKPHLVFEQPGDEISINYDDYVYNRIGVLQSITKPPYNRLPIKSLKLFPESKLKVFFIDSNAFKDNEIKELTFPTSVWRGTIGDRAFIDNSIERLDFTGFDELWLRRSAFLRNQIKEIKWSKKVTVNVDSFKNNNIETLDLEMFRGMPRRGGLPDGIFENNKIKHIIWQKLQDGELNNRDYDNIETEEKFWERFGITFIGKQAFANNELEALSFASFPITIDGLYLDDEAFENNKIETIEFVPGIHIGSGAFRNNELTSLDLEGVAVVKAHGFQKNKLKSVILSDVEDFHIGQGAFSDNYIEDLMLGSALKEITSRSFSNNQLIELTIPNQIEVIHNDAFVDNYLRKIIIEDENQSGLLLKGRAFSGQKGPSGQQIMGWFNSTDFIDANEVKVESEAGEEIKITGSVTLYAYYMNNVYFNENGGTAVADFQNIPSFSKLNEENYVTKRTGYNFVGWYTDSTLKESFDFDQAILDHTTLYAKWTKDPIVAVRFLDEDGRLISKEVIEKGSSAIPPIPPQKFQKVFSGWRGEYENLIKDTDIYATYEADINENHIADSHDPRYTISFFDFENNLIEKQENILVGLNGVSPYKNIKEDAPQITDMICVGWDKSFENIIENLNVKLIYKEDLNHNQIPDENEIYFDLIFKSHEDIEIKRISHILSGFGVDVTGDKTPNSPNDDLPKPVERPLYIFDGWKTLDGRAIDLKNINNVTEVELILKATYSQDFNNNGLADEDEAHFMITFFDQDGTIYKKIEHHLIFMSLSLPEPLLIKEKIFVGWDDLNDNTDNEWLSMDNLESMDVFDLKRNALQKHIKNKMISIESDLEFKAVYVDDLNKNDRPDILDASYQVLYKDYNGSLLKKESVLEGLTSEPPYVSRPGYTFLGWSETIEKTPILKNREVFAVYEKEKTNGGGGSSGGSSSGGGSSKKVNVSNTVLATEEVNKLNSRSYMIGYPDGRFGLDDGLTRASLVVMLDRFYNFVESSEKERPEDKFSDVIVGSWYEDAVYNMAKEKIITGYPDGTFRPNDQVTREELIAIIYKTMAKGSIYKRPNLDKYKEDYKYPYIDIENSWSFEAVVNLHRKGLLHMFDNPKLHANKTITRLEAVQLLNTYFCYDKTTLAKDAKCAFTDVVMGTSIYEDIVIATQDFTAYSPFIIELDNKIIGDE